MGELKHETTVPGTGSPVVGKDSFPEREAGDAIADAGCDLWCRPRLPRVRNLMQVEVEMAQNERSSLNSLIF